MTVNFSQTQKHAKLTTDKTKAAVILVFHSLLAVQLSQTAFLTLALLSHPVQWQHIITHS